MKLTNNNNISLSVAVWLGSDSYDHNNDPNHISATGLLKSVKQIILTSRMDNKDIEFDIADQIPSSMGTALHEGIERAWMQTNGFANALHKMGYASKLIDRIKLNPTKDQMTLWKENGFKVIPVYMEQRSTKEISGRTVSGKYDFVGEGTLEDFKSCGTFKYTKMLKELESPSGTDGLSGSDTEKTFQLQGSIYKWLNPEIITSDYMIIQFIFTDWSKLQSMVQEKNGYPAARVQAHKIPLMSPEWTENWIKTKLALIDSLQDAEQDQIPECTNEELWRGKSVFAYYKNPEGKRATKNYDEYHNAHAHYIKDGSIGVINERKAQVKRCLYCDAFDLCEQKNTYLLDGSLVV